MIWLISYFGVEQFISCFLYANTPPEPIAPKKARPTGGSKQHFPITEEQLKARGPWLLKNA